MFYAERMRISTILLLMLLLSACQNSVQNSAKTIAPTGGRAIFLNNCVGCHRGAGDGPNAIITGSAQLSASEDGFRAFLRSPTSPTMPAFNEGRLSDADIAELYKYFQDIKTGRQ